MREKRTKLKKSLSRQKHRRKVTARQRVARLVAVTVLVIAAMAALYGILTADHNSRLVGWDENRTELAFDASEDRLNFTVVGQDYYIDTAPITGSTGIYTQLRRGINYLKPSPMRMADMLYQYVKEKLK